MNETTKEYTVTEVENLKISDADITGKGVSSLRQTPNRGSTYGTDGLSAKKLKERFDQLPAFVAEKLNALIQSLYAGDFPLGSEEKKEKKSISELLDSVGNGELAGKLKLATQNTTLADFVSGLLTSVTNGELAGKLKLSSDENAKSLYDLWCGISDGALAKALILSDEGELAAALNSKADAESVENALKNYATKNDLENKIKDLVGDAPEALDTLHEIVQLLGAEGSDLSKTILGRIAEVKSEAEAANRALSSKAEESALTAALEVKADKTTVSTELGDLRKRVVNLEHGLTLDPFRIDSEVAYTKSPPEGVLPYARIIEVGGRSTVHKNLFDLAKLGSWFYSEGEAIPNDRGGVNINTSGGGAGTVHHGVTYGDGDWTPTPLTDFCDVQVGKTYTMSCVSEHGRVVLGYNPETGEGGVVVSPGAGKTFVMTQAIIHGGIMFEYTDSGNHGFGDDFSYSVDQIVLVEGTVAGEHIANAIVTSIDVVGENKLPYPYPLLPKEVTVDGLTITPRADGSILLNGTLEKPGSWNYLSVYLHGNPTEGSSLDGSILTGKAKSTLFLEPGYHYAAPNQMEGAHLLLKRNGALGSSKALNIKETDEYHQVGYVYYLSLVRGTTFNNAVLYPYIVKGQVAPETWTPYACERVEIPEAVRALPGYGMGTETYYNRVVWNDDGTVSYIRAVDDDGNVISPAVSTDVTEHFSGSNVIKVAPGDVTITAVNDKRLPVPFSIKYQLKQYVYE